MSCVFGKDGQLGDRTDDHLMSAYFPLLMPVEVGRVSMSSMQVLADGSTSFTSQAQDATVFDGPLDTLSW